MEKMRVKDQENLYRDKKSKAIVSSDKRAYLHHLQQKKLSETAHDVSQRVDQLENKMDQVISLLQQSINNK